MQSGRMPLFTERYLSDPPDLKIPVTPAEPPPAPTRRKPRGILFWVKQGLLFPLRLIGLILLIVLIPGMVGMWQLPTVAEDNDLELALLAMRAIDQERSTRPFALLGYWKTTTPAMVDLCPHPPVNYHLPLSMFTANFYHLSAVSTSVERIRDGRYRYYTRYNHSDLETAEATTPHLTVPKTDLADARHAINRLFQDRQQQREVLEWGESLFWTEWLRQNPLSKVPKKLIPDPLGGTEEERFWLAWQVLRGDHAEAKEELFHLPELFQKAFPRAEDREAARKWAEDLYDRLERDLTDYQGGLRELLAFRNEHSNLKVEAWDENNPYESIHISFKRVLPPKTEWTYYWLVYRYAGLTPASRAAARSHWLGLFPRNCEADVLDLGNRLVEARRAAGEALPPVPETLPLVAVAERLVGTDPYGHRCRETLQNAFGSLQPMLKFTIMSIYPNDETFYLIASPDGLQMHPISGETQTNTLEVRLTRLAGSTSFPLMAALAFGTLLHWIVVPLLMPRRSRPLWEKHLEGRGQEPIWLWACSVLFFAAIGALLAPLGLPDTVGVQMDSYGTLFMGSLAATLVGGVLIGTFRRILAVVLIIVGVDVEATWLDEVLGILLGAFVLYHFGNDVLAIGVYALSDLAPGVIEMLRHRNHHEPSPGVALLPASA
jgi:hypothetical protein